ncbi:MAG: GAF domain-containing protein [Acidobacteria bacterium]|nr:GAF domain-containing protein [Acidobacteriota bacterium]
MPVNKHLEKAERFLQKGKLEAAVEELLIARNEEPGNDEIILSLAEAYLHLNRPVDCRQCFAHLFDRYAERGDVDKAFDYFRRMQKLGVAEPKRLIACARLVEKQRPKEASEYYTQALESPAGQNPEIALQCVQGLAGLQPSSIELQQRLAELAAKTGRRELAAGACRRVGELLSYQNQFPEAADALETAFNLCGETPAARMALAKMSARAQRFARVLALLAAQEGTDDPEALTLLAEAYHLQGELPHAERVYWKLADSSPAVFTPLTDIAVEYLRQQNVKSALPLLKKLEERLSASKQQSGLVSLCEKVSHVENPGSAVLDFFCTLSDHLHLDGPFEKALAGLFEFYFNSGEFGKATEALERLVDIDSYSSDRSEKLRRLEGKADPAIWKELAARLGQTSSAAKVAPAPAAAAVPVTKAASPPAAEVSADSDSSSGLGDLILQAEIFLQYKLHDKARERLERIARQFPGEEARNEELRLLYERAGFVSQTAQPVPKAAPSAVVETQAEWSRIAELIRNLGRQGTVKGVLSTAVNGIGRLWQCSRCVAGLAVPKHPPTLVLEYTNPPAQASDAALLGRLVMGLQLLVEEQGGPLVVEKISEFRRLAPLKVILAGLQIESLAAIPLREEDQPSGIVILEQCGNTRNWTPNDIAALETVAEQVSLAGSNARLRALMRTLAVTDQRSGLLHRDSYINCLISEADRMREQQTPLAAAVLRFSRPNGGRRTDEALDGFLQQFRTTFASHLRQNDIPIKYDAQSLAVILPATTGKQALFMVEKMRKLASSLPAPGTPPPPAMAAGVAEAVREGDMDSTDIVTELINRVDSALEEAQSAGGDSTKVVEPPSLPR